MKRMAIERAEAQEQRTSENTLVDQSDADLQVVNEVQVQEPQPTVPQEVQSSDENESVHEFIDMDEYGLLEREFSTEYDISEQLEEVQEVATEVEFSTEYDLLEHLGKEDEEPQVQESQEESNTESDKLEERTDNALQRAIAMLRRTERPK
jgi:hypothetical protein